MIATAVGVGIWNILGSINPAGRGINTCRNEMIIPKKRYECLAWVGYALAPAIKKSHY